LILKTLRLILKSKRLKLNRLQVKTQLNDVENISSIAKVWSEFILEK